MEKAYSCKKQNFWKDDEPSHLDTEDFPKDFVGSVYSGNDNPCRDFMFERSLSNPPFTDMDLRLYNQIDDLMNPKRVGEGIEKLAKN